MKDKLDRHMGVLNRNLIEIGKDYVDAYLYLEDFVNKLKNNQIDDSFDNYLNDIVKEKIKIINKENILYRSRIYREIDAFVRYKDKTDEVFKGYDEKNSFVKLSNISSGRMNHEDEICLYTASNINTSIFEVDPNCYSYVSVAEIKLLDNLKVIDFSKASSGIDDNFKRYLSILIQSRLSDGNGEDDYYLPRYIARKCKDYGFDGLIYKSRFSRDPKLFKDGVNYAIFSYEKCKAISSKLYFVRSFNIDAETY